MGTSFDVLLAIQFSFIMPCIDVNVAITNPKSTSTILHTARGVQKKTLNLPMRVADTLDLGCKTLRVGGIVFARKSGNQSVLTGSIPGNDPTAGFLFPRCSRGTLRSSRACRR
jgi:hypothetical protein